MLTIRLMSWASIIAKPKRIASTVYSFNHAFAIIMSFRGIKQIFYAFLSLATLLFVKATVSLVNDFKEPHTVRYVRLLTLFQYNLDTRKISESNTNSRLSETDTVSNL